MSARQHEPVKLPRGRHRIPREDVVRHQRYRMLEAMVRTVGDKGYANTSVQDVLERAGVSRRTFYEHFKDKEACFLQAYDAVVERVMHDVRAAYEQPGSWPQRVRVGLEVFLKFFSYEQALASVITVEVLAAGPEAVERYRAAVRGFIPFLREGRAHARRPEQLPDEIEEAVVGGVAAVIFDRVASGRGAEVPSLLPQLLYFTLVPYLGSGRAAKAAAARDALP